jgi:hypothetical protein
MARVLAKIPNVAAAPLTPTSSPTPSLNLVLAKLTCFPSTVMEATMGIPYVQVPLPAALVLLAHRQAYQPHTGYRFSPLLAGVSSGAQIFRFLHSFGGPNLCCDQLLYTKLIRLYICLKRGWNSLCSGKSDFHDDARVSMNRRLVTCLLPCICGLLLRGALTALYVLYTASLHRLYGKYPGER